MRKYNFYIIPIILIFGLGTIVTSQVHAQQESEEGNGEAEQTTQTEEPGVQDEEMGQGEADAGQSGGGFFSSLKFWENWGSPPAPDTTSQWHSRVGHYLNLENDEYFRHGYARINETWLPVFFLRRFDMNEKQYVHTLVIKGRPQKSPKIKGIDMGDYGMEVSNLGFDVRMPKFPSVSRAAKAQDEEEALKLCEVQLELYGFDDVNWLPGQEEELRNLADTWNIE